jgi:hypothetical protein
MGTKHKHYDVIVAWAAGEEIEYRLDPNDSWLSIVDPSWNSSTEYRIKPKRVKKEGWVNVYPRNACGMSIYANKDEADFWAREHRVACSRIEWEEEA